MFARVKRTGNYEYLQIVENRRENGRARQRVVATLGRLDRLKADGDVDVLMRSLGRFAQRIRIQEAHARGDLKALGAWSIGPALAFGRLWDQLKLPGILGRLRAGRNFAFDVERAVFTTVLHRLCETGSDRQAVRWLAKTFVPGAEEIGLHHLYRAMAWLGGVKDEVERELFCAHRDLFTELSLVFFDTTSIYFEGRGGSLGELGISKDRMPDHRQVVVGALLTQSGRPIGCDIAPGNQADAKALLPVVDKARSRFGLKRVCWVADRGMCSAAVIRGLEEREMEYILGARLRRVKEIRELVLAQARDFQDAGENLKVCEVNVEGRRYVVCHNPYEAAKDKADREAILADLGQKLKNGPKSLVGNRGFRRYLKVDGGAVHVDEEKAKAEERFDGKFVLRTNTNLPAVEVAKQYKRLWMVEAFFRAGKSLLETRPIFHQSSDAIRGHIFCSFLALLLRHELLTRLAARREKPEWSDVVRDVAALQEVEVQQDGERYRLRLPLQGVCGKVLQAVGVAIPPPVRMM